MRVRKTDAKVVQVTRFDHIPDLTELRNRHVRKQIK